jgi:uncharacterized protein (DUF58 family)
LFTAKATAYFSTAVALLTAALLLGDFRLAIFVLGLASIFFLSNIWGLPERVDLELERKIVPNETFGGENVRIESRVRNRTSSRLVNVTVREVLDERIIPEMGSSQMQFSIGPHRESRIAFEFPSPSRSRYQIGPLIAQTRDPLGLYLTETRLDPEIFSVMPRPERLVGVQLRPRHVGPWPGLVPSRILGSGTEFYSMRDYVYGDDPKRINWKASARYNSLIVNETEAERVTDVMMVLDTDVTLFASEENEIFEREVHATASIANLLLKQGNRVGLVLQGGERGAVPAGFGKRHERRILHLLAAAQPGRATVSTSYVMILLARHMLPSRAQIVVISPLLDPDVKEGIRQLTIAGYSMLVLSPTPSAPQAFKDRTEETAFKLIMLERAISLLALEKSATVIDWPGPIPLSAVITQVRRVRPILAG